MRCSGQLKTYKQNTGKETNKKREVLKKFMRKISLASARANAGLRLNKQTNRRKGKQPNKKEKSGKSF